MKKVKGTVKEGLFALDRFRTQNNSEGSTMQAASARCSLRNGGPGSRDLTLYLTTGLNVLMWFLVVFF